MARRDVFLECGFFVLFLMIGAEAVRAADTGRLVVDSEAGELLYYQPGSSALVFANISVGRYGTSAKKQRGDNATPLGTYRIGWIKHESGFKAFVGLNYPSIRDAQRGLRDGLVTEREYRAILSAHRTGAVPPQTTALGGFIGIHGLGEGDPQLHGRYNWTKGCIAVTNEQLHSLLQKIRLGMPVEIR